MAKYRIIKHEYPNGSVHYIPQKRILHLFWISLSDSWGTIDMYRTLEAAQMAIKMDNEDEHHETIIPVN